MRLTLLGTNYKVGSDKYPATLALTLYQLSWSFAQATSSASKAPSFLFLTPTSARRNTTQISQLLQCNLPGERFWDGSLLSSLNPKEPLSPLDSHSGSS